MPRYIEIEDLNAGELDVYARLNEVNLLRLNEPDTGIFIAESPNVILRAIAAGYSPISFLMDSKNVEKEAVAILEKPEYENVPVYVAKEEVLKDIIGIKLTRGLLCAMNRKRLPSVEEVLKGARRIVIMEDVVNPTNVGAIFRSAAALGMDAVLLTEPSSDPLYKRAIRVSMGTVFQIPWTIFPKRADYMNLLKGLGFKTVAMALREDSVSITDEKLCAEDKLAIIMGTEGEGLKNETIEASDYTVMIPMSHGVDSLNVAAAASVAFWQLGIHD